MRAEDDSIGGVEVEGDIMRVMIIPDNTCYAPPQWLHGHRAGSGLTMSNYAIQSPDYPLSVHSQTQSIGMEIFLFFYQLSRKYIHFE